MSKPQGLNTLRVVHPVQDVRYELRGSKYRDEGECRAIKLRFARAEIATGTVRCHKRKLYSVRAYVPLCTRAPKRCSTDN